MHHTDQRSVEVVDEWQRGIGQAETLQRRIDQAFLAQQHQPAIGPHQDRGPERQHDQDQHAVCDTASGAGERESQGNAQNHAGDKGAQR